MRQFRADRNASSNLSGAWAWKELGQHVSSKAPSNATALKIDLKDTLNTPEPNANDTWFALQSQAWREAFVLPSQRLVFCKIAKVGSSGWLRLLRWAEGQKGWANHPYFVDAHGHVAGLKQLKHFSKEKAMKMLFSPNWTKMVVLRDPLERLQSAFLDKIARAEDVSYGKILSERLYSLPFQQFTSTDFQDFLTRVELGILESPNNKEDQHWKRQSQFCGLHHFHPWYSEMVYMPPKQFNQSEAVLASVLRGIAKKAPDPWLVKQFTWPKPAQRTISEHSTLAREVFDERSCKKALSLYARDYELFGLPRPSCCADHPHVRWSLGNDA